MRKSRSRQADTYALLVVFQAMDAAGKDSAIEHVMSGVESAGRPGRRFGKPSSEEARPRLSLADVESPYRERGRIGIFNRSHYEEGRRRCACTPEWLAQ